MCSPTSAQGRHGRAQVHLCQCKTRIDEVSGMERRIAGRMMRAGGRSSEIGSEIQGRCGPTAIQGGEDATVHMNQRTRDSWRCSPSQLSATMVKGTGILDRKDEGRGGTQCGMRAGCAGWRRSAAPPLTRWQRGASCPISLLLRSFSCTDNAQSLTITCRATQDSSAECAAHPIHACTSCHLRKWHIGIAPKAD